jgi:hypothetical protein
MLIDFHIGCFVEFEELFVYRHLPFLLDLDDSDTIWFKVVKLYQNSNINRIVMEIFGFLNIKPISFEQLRQYSVGILRPIRG